VFPVKRSLGLLIDLLSMLCYVCDFELKRNKFLLLGLKEFLLRVRLIFLLELFIG
jgi:hypothetical protein